MNPNLLFEQHTEEDLAEYFSEYTVLDLQSNLLQLIQTNIIYSYCESLIIEDLENTEEDVAKILECCQQKNIFLLQSNLPFTVLQKLKTVKNEITKSNLDRYEIIDSILNLIVENTLLYSSLAKFAYH